MMIEHLPKGDGPLCSQCNAPFSKHRKPRSRIGRKDTRVFHRPEGDGPLCSRCNLPASKHREPRPYRYEPPGRPSREDTRSHSEKCTYFGIDGEGQTDRSTGQHRYVMLAAAGEDGSRHIVENPNGLSTIECFEFLTGLPNNGRVKLFAYSFGYDLTKILTDLPNEKLYKLYRPEERRKFVKGHWLNMPVEWRGYKLNYLNGRFSVAKQTGQVVRRSQIGEKFIKATYGKGATVNDIWRFFQGKFTTALGDWKIGSKELLDRMRLMKDKRADFDKLTAEEVRNYCFEECECMAQLARRLVEAHEAAGLTLKNYYGAGSTGSAMLSKMGIGEHIAMARKTHPEPEGMQRPLACAFFGGRFENSVIGCVPGPVYSYDISSAYPYHICFLPCLLHGKWEHVKGARARTRAWHGRAALIRYTLDKPKFKDEPWAPFPYRTDNGSIAFPSESAGGWVWRDEYFAGEHLFPNARCLEAWVYECGCDCQPFKDVPFYYRERVRIGKEGPGIVLKLGLNSEYGKLAQSLGGLGPFTCWVWAGMITSGCRAQILEILALHSDPANLLMVATDGIATREKLAMPLPKETGTGGPLPTPEGTTEKPLGGWEMKVIEKGLFLARPGIYFPLDPTEKELNQVRGRGLGRSVVYEQWAAIVEAYKQGKQIVHVKDLSRFIGAKTSISRSQAGVYKRAKEYGQWIVRPVEMTFNPLPKREGITRVSGTEYGTLGVRAFPSEPESSPYDKAIVSPEAAQLRQLTEEALEQPDGGDLTQYEPE